MDVGWIFQCFVRESLPNAAILTSLLTSLHTLTFSHLSSHLSYTLTSLNVTNKKVPESNSFRHEWWFGDQVALAKLASLQKAGHKVPGWAISAKWAAHQRHQCITATTCCNVVIRIPCHVIWLCSFNETMDLAFIRQNSMKTCFLIPIQGNGLHHLFMRRLFLRGWENYVRDVI